MGTTEDEIVLNDGYVFDARFFDLEWKYSEPFGERMGLLDLDEGPDPRGHRRVSGPLPAHL